MRKCWNEPLHPASVRLDLIFGESFDVAPHLQEQLVTSVLDPEEDTGKNVLSCFTSKFWGEEALITYGG